MRYLVISDIHANLEALEAVLAVAGETEATLVLGDLVGYGADPNAVIDRVRQLPGATIIRGNHDKVGSRLESVRSFNHLARFAIEWTANELTDERRNWLAALPQGPLVVDDLVEICHGSPFDEDVYVFEEVDARRSLNVSRRPLCLFGHTHLPAAFRLGGPLEQLGPPRGPRFDLPLTDDGRYLVNCGAVGQPRDGDSRAAFGILDTDRKVLSILRVAYDLATAQTKIMAAGLPEVLAQRLAVGR